MPRFNKFHPINVLQTLGFAYEDAHALRRISMILHRWAELECGDANGNAIERDETTGKPRMYHSGRRFLGANDPRMWSSVPDREAGALRRLGAIMARYPSFTPYHQTDPRGAALYILRPTDIIPGHDIGSIYSRGIAVYK